MPTPYSMDLRRRVVSEVDRGTPPAQVAQQFQVAERTIWNWLALRKETGQLAPRQGDVGPDCILEVHRQRILKSVQDDPGLTLAQRQMQLGLPGCATTLWNALRRWNVTLKKSAHSC
jgi:transposase